MSQTGIPASTPATRTRSVIGATQREIYEHIAREKRPMLASEISRGMRIHLTTCLYHVRRLQKEGLVIHRDGAWGIAESFTGQAIIQGAGGRRLIETIRRFGPLDQKTAAQHLRISPAGVCALVKRLESRQVVFLVREGRRMVIHDASLPNAHASLAARNSKVRA